MRTTHAGSRHRWITVGTATALCATSLVFTQPAVALGESDSQGLRKAVSTDRIKRHLHALQTIADTYGGGNRLAGTAGYDKSAEYEKSKLVAAGYHVTEHAFTFQLNSERTPSVLAQTGPSSRTFTNGVDFAAMSYSGSGDVTAAVTAVDIVEPPGAPNSSTSGCEAADFAGFPAGTIALVQRGACSFRLKAENAKAAGAIGTIVFNEGQTGRTGVINGTLAEPAFDQPVVGATYEVGQALSNGVSTGSTGSTARLRTDMINELRSSVNLLAETPGGDPNSVVVVGAHLDSVSRGAGINDNGSGSATVLTLAEQFAARGITPRNKVRFAWWGAEEHGLIGSNRYVASLSEAELAKIKMNLNFDMIGSPNYARFVYDGDNSAYPAGTGSAAGPDGSGEIERVFHQYFASQNLASEETPFSGRSDYGPFIAKGIPAGGLFTGAEGVKTAEQAAKFGGTAGVAYDACYHLACDTIANVNMQGLDEMSDAVAHTTLHFAKRNFVKYPLVNPAGPVGPGGGTTSGGGLHDDHDHEAEES